MKKIRKLLLLGVGVASCALATITAHSSVLVSGFGTNIAPEDLTGTWINNYNSASSIITATDAPGSGISDYTGPSIGDFGSFNLLQLTASVAVNPNTDFSIILEDVNGFTATAAFNWTSFSTSTSSVLSSLSFDTGFDTGSVIGWTLETGGVGNPLTAQFQTLSVVPEPQAWLLIVGALLLMTVFRKRSKAVA